MADSLEFLEQKIRDMEARLARTEADVTKFRSDIFDLKYQLRIAYEALSRQPKPSTPSQAQTPAPAVPQTTVTSPQPLNPYGNTASRPAPVYAPRGPSEFDKFIESMKKKLKERIGEIPVEEFLGMNLLNKIGILILVLGVSFFLKIAYGWISPLMKVALLSLISIGIMVAGDFFYRRKNYVIFGLGLISGGMVMLFFTAFASYNYEATRIISNDLRYAGYGIQAILTGLMIANSLRYNREAMTSFAYFLSFMCVSINETGEFNHFSLLVLALLALSLIVVIAIKKWKYLTGLGVFATYANFFFYSMSLPRGSDGYVIRGESDLFLLSLVYLFIYWSVFHVSTFTMKSETALDVRAVVMVNIANASAFLGLVAYIRPEPTVWGGLTIFGTLGVIYVLSAIFARFRGLTHIWKSSLVIGSSFIALGLGLRFSGPSLILVWLIQATTMVITGYLFQEKYLRNLGYLAFILKVSALMALPGADILLKESAPISFDLEINRSSVYLGLIASALSIQIVSRKFEKTPIDQVAWHILGVLLVMSVTLLSLFTIQLPHQAILIVPSAVALVLLSRIVNIREHVYYGLILLIMAFFISVPLLISGDAFKTAIDPLVGILLLFFGSAAIFGFFFSPIQTEQMRADARKLENILYGCATVSLAVTVLVTISIIVVYPPKWATALFAIPPSIALAYLEKKTGHGRIHFLGLCVFIFGLTLFQAIVSSRSGAETDRIIFLANGGVLWLIATAPLWIFRQLRTGTGLIPRALLVVASVEAILLIRDLVHPPLYPLAVCAYALAHLIVSIYFKSPAAIASAVISTFAFLVGPMRWLFAFSDVTDPYARLSMAGVTVILGLSALASWRTDSKLPSYFYYLGFASAYISTYVILPLEFHALIFSAYTGAAFLILRAQARSELKPSGPIWLALSIISFIYLLFKFNLYPQVREEWMKAVLGFLPLGILAVCVRLYSDALKLQSLKVSKDKFRMIVITLLFLLFVVLTMTLTDARYWSVAWAAEATAFVFFGLVWRLGALRYAGMALIVIMLLKVGFWDLKNLEDTIRVAVLVGIGLLLVGASFLYARFKDRLLGVADEQK